MQEPSPPPYTSSEFDLTDNHLSTPNLAYPPPPLPYSSSVPCSHSKCHFRRRASHPAHSDSDTEDDAIYTSRHRIPKDLNLPQADDDDDDDSIKRSAPTVTIATATATIRRKWSWRHWLFALAAGVVGLNDDWRDDDEREREQRVICTTPGGACAGETETETDEPSRHLPTARTISPTESSPLPESTLQHLQRRGLPVLFECSRMLSVVPAFFGTVWNLYWLVWPHNGEMASLAGRRSGAHPVRADFFLAALWAILTGYQCLALTTGLLTRWRTYYPPLATLIRLLALQGICWPATHVTLSVLDHVRRPVVCWCVVGTTTCFSRGVQIWVTSNISVGDDDDDAAVGKDGDDDGSVDARRVYRPRRLRPRFSAERRWDWKEVSLKCVLPAGVLYFVMAWVGELRREWAGC